MEAVVYITFGCLIMSSALMTYAALRLVRRAREDTLHRFIALKKQVEHERKRKK